MTWVKIDDGYPDHPKVHRLGKDAPCGMALDVAAKCYASAHLTDGRIPAIVLPRLVIGLPNPKRFAERLVEVGLWERDGADYVIHDYLKYNPSRADVESQRESRSRAGKAGANSKWNGKSDDKPDGTLPDTGDDKPDAPVAPVGPLAPLGSIPPVMADPTPEERQEAADAVAAEPVALDEWDVFDAWLNLTGHVPMPHTVVRDWLYRLGETFGHRATSQALAAEIKLNADRRDLLGRTEKRLKAAAFRAEQAEKRDEKRRNAAKRAPVRVLPTPDDISDEEADRIADELLSRPAS